MASEGATLVVPADALTAAVAIAMERSTAAPPAGYLAQSALYTLTPDGQQFSKPVSVAIEFTGSATGLVVFHSRLGGVGFDALTGAIEGNTVTVSIDHFSVLFAGTLAVEDGGAGGGAGGGTGGGSGGTGATPEILAAGPAPTSGIAVDATHVYWNDNKPYPCVKRAPLGGGAAEVVTQLTGNGGYINSGLVVDATAVYTLDTGGLIATSGVLVRAPLGGTLPVAAEKIAERQGNIALLALDGTTLFWGTKPAATAELRSISTSAAADGGTPWTTVTAMSSGSTYRGFAVVGADLFFGAQASIQKVAKAGGGGISSLLAQQTNLKVMTADADGVYWLVGTGNNADGELRRAPLTGGAATTLATGLIDPIHLAVDGQYVYVLDQGAASFVVNMDAWADGAITKYPKAGGAGITVVSGQTNLKGMAISGGYLYSTLGSQNLSAPDGKVFRVPK